MKSYLIDLDGTMYRGNENIDGAREFIAWCIAKQQPFYFLTNNATRTRLENVQHMEKLGFKGIREDQFFYLKHGGGAHDAKIQHEAQRIYDRPGRFKRSLIGCRV